MRALPLAFAVLVGAAVPSRRALAQDPGAADQARARVDEVERGLYAGAQLGALVLHVPGKGSGIAAGPVVGIDFGYDFSRFAGIGVFALGASLVAPSGYEGLGPGTTSGDFSSVFPGLELRFHIPIARDHNEVERVFFTVNAGGGYMFLTPSGLFPSNGPAARVGLGLEYYTHLRHFSLGLTLDGVAAFLSGGQLVGGSLSPFLRYSF